MAAGAGGEHIVNNGDMAACHLLRIGIEGAAQVASAFLRREFGLVGSVAQAVLSETELPVIVFPPPGR